MSARLTVGLTMIALVGVYVWCALTGNLMGVLAASVSLLGIARLTVLL